MKLLLVLSLVLSFEIASAREVVDIGTVSTQIRSVPSGLNLTKVEREALSSFDLEDEFLLGPMEVKIPRTGKNTYLLCGHTWEVAMIVGYHQKKCAAFSWNSRGEGELLPVKIIALSFGLQGGGAVGLSGTRLFDVYSLETLKGGYLSVNSGFALGVGPNMSWVSVTNQRTGVNASALDLDGMAGLQLNFISGRVAYLHISRSARLLKFKLSDETMAILRSRY